MQLQLCCLLRVRSTVNVGAPLGALLAGLYAEAAIESRLGELHMIEGFVGEEKLEKDCKITSPSVLLPSTTQHHS